jgi:sugar phosphate isomerase/epimerase
MQRRNFLKASAAALAAQAAFGQASAKLKIDCYSRHLQWLRNADEVAEAAAEMGFEGLDITVRTYPGHVDPAKVAADLPPFVNAVRKHGLQVSAITTNISDADSPYAEDILRAASQAGITHYWWGTYRYDNKSPVMAQLDELKPRVAKLAALNAKYKMKAMYHTYSGNVQVGSALWDMLYVMREFDPAHISFHYDTGHQTNAGGNGTWSLGMRAAGPYIGGISVKDSIIEPTFVDAGGGGSLANQPNVNMNERQGAPPAGAQPQGAAGGGGQGQRQGGQGQRPAAAQNPGAQPGAPGGPGGRPDTMR